MTREDTRLVAHETQTPATNRHSITCNPAKIFLSVLGLSCLGTTGYLWYRATKMTYSEPDYVGALVDGSYTAKMPCDNVPYEAFPPDFLNQFPNITKPNDAYYQTLLDVLAFACQQKQAVDVEVHFERKAKTCDDVSVQFFHPHRPQSNQGVLSALFTKFTEILNEAYRQIYPALNLQCKNAPHFVITVVAAVLTTIMGIGASIAAYYVNSKPKETDLHYRAYRTA